MQVKGVVKVCAPTVVVSEKFSKRELVVTVEGEYPQHISIQFTQGKCALLDGIREGQTVDVSINLRGREWVSPQGEVKYFNTIEGWKVDAEPHITSQPSATVEEEDDILPF